MALAPKSPADALPGFLLGILCCVFVLHAAGASAAESTQLPGLVRTPLTLTVALPEGRSVRLEAMVIRPDRAGRQPLVVINHGTPRNADDIPLTAPGRLLGIATAFAQRGWAAAIVLRRGYGKSDGPLAENSGGCDDRDYVRAGLASADDVLGALAALRAEPWVDPTHVLLLGHSAGGFAVIAAASRNPAGVLGVVSFAGGRGSSRPDVVCQPERLVEAMASFGRTARIPSLWIYAENDHFFGPALAAGMVKAYTAAGAPAAFVAASAYGADGHQLMFGPPALWQAPVDRFLGALGLPNRVDIVLPPTPNLTPPQGQSAAAAFATYLASTAFEKAFAAGGRSAFGYQTGERTVEDAQRLALERCRRVVPDCRIYAVGNRITR
jgi:dienelactone hydrolase